MSFGAAGPAHEQSAAPRSTLDVSQVHAAARAAAAAAGGPLLSLDTSTQTASLSLVTPDAVDVTRLDARLLPSEAVMPALVATLEAAQLSPHALRALIIGLGPGSFTGLRVGLATFKGLGYAASLPLYGTSSLAMLAAAAGPGRVTVVRDARRGSAYLGTYTVERDGTATALAEDACLDVGALPARLAALAAAPGPYVAVGDAAAQALLPGLQPLPAPDATLLVVQAAARLARGEADDLSSLAPAYLQAMVPPGRTA